MDKDPFSRFAGDGLIKSADKPLEGVPSDRKAKLNRKGNELFNAGDIEAARRIYQTTGYSDGLIRVGDRYLADRRPVEALKMYTLAREERKSAELIGKAALVIQNILSEREDEK